MTLYPEYRLIWLPTLQVIQGLIHGSGHPVVTNENPVFRSRVNALVHGDDEWHKWISDIDWVGIIPGLIKIRNKRIVSLYAAG